MYLKVTVLDKNDSPPVFRDTPLTFNVSEDLNAGHLIATIRASDPDTLGSLSYSVLGGDDGKFLLEPDTGKLRLKDALDRELKNNYKLRVRVSDGVQHTDTLIIIELLLFLLLLNQKQKQQIQQRDAFVIKSEYGLHKMHTHSYPNIEPSTQV
ncbi:hypothetical protein GQX74_010358 [Glossina fuscipes]|nr:hypothetical protein GQX74_010358 [Glossina fuscipes]